MCYANRPNVILLGLPGGVPVAFEVNKAVRVALDVFVARKPSAPGQRELTMGAIAMESVSGMRISNRRVTRR